MTEGVLQTGRLPEMAAVPPDAWLGPERVADLVVQIATGRADALSGRFLFALDDVEDLIRRAEDLSGGTCTRSGCGGSEEARLTRRLSTGYRFPLQELEAAVHQEMGGAAIPV